MSENEPQQWHNLVRKYYTTMDEAIGEFNDGVKHLWGHNKFVLDGQLSRGFELVSGPEIEYISIKKDDTGIYIEMRTSCFLNVIGSGR